MNPPLIRSNRLRLVALWLAPACIALCQPRQDGFPQSPPRQDEAREKIGVLPPDRRPDGLRVVPRPTPRLDVEIWTDRSHYRIGSDVRVYFRVERDARVYIFNTDASGHCSQIFPNAFDRDNWVRGGRTYSIPDSRYRLVATGPVGRESLTLVAYAEQTIYWREYHEFQSPSHPFPERPGGAGRMLEQLKSLGGEEGAGRSSSQPSPPAPPPSLPPRGESLREEPDPTPTPSETKADSRDKKIQRREQRDWESEPEKARSQAETKDPARLRIEPLPPRPPVHRPLYGEATTYFHVDYGHFRPGPPPWRWEGPPRWPPRPLPYPTPVPPAPTPPYDPYQPPWWRP